MKNSIDMTKFNRVSIHPHFKRPVGWLSMLLSIAILASCEGAGGGQGQEGFKDEYFTLTIALAEPQGQLDGPLSDEIKKLWMPVTSKNCPGSIFAPDKVNLIRLDLPDAKPEELQLGKLQNGVQSGLGQKVTLKRASSVREKAISEQRISKLMAAPAGVATVIPENLQRLLGNAANQSILTTPEIAQSLNGKEALTGRNLSELQTVLASNVCGNASQTAKPSGVIIIYYKTGNDVTVNPPVNQATSSVSSPEEKREIEKLLRVIYTDGIKTTDEQRELAQLLSKYQRNPNQIAQLEQETKDRMNQAAVSLKQGMVYASQKAYTQAVKEFRHGVEVDPQNAFTWANLCGAYLSLGDLDQANQTCSQATDVDPNNWLAHYNRGSLSAKQGKKAETIQALAAALRGVAEEQNQHITQTEVVRQIKADPTFTSLRKDPEFQRLLITR